MPKEEIKSKGGLILADAGNDHRTTTKENQADLAIVLAVGNGYYDDETGADVDLDIRPGMVVLLSAMGMKRYSQFPGLEEYTKESIALTRDTEIHVAWESIEAYLEYKKALNS